MKIKDTLIGAGAVLLAFGGLGATAALAANSTPSNPPAVDAPASPKTPEPTTAGDTDTIQEGDQTTQTLQVRRRRAT